MNRLPTLLLCSTISAQSAVLVTDPTNLWNAISYANPANADASGDQQTGIRDADIVGSAADASFYTFFNGDGPLSLTDGEMGFRLRVAGDKNPSGFESVFWVGIDANLDGKIDLFAGADEDSTVGLYAAGPDANNSPSTTSIDTTTPFYEVTTSLQNYRFEEVTSALDPGVTSLNLDGGGGGGGNHTDHFISFSIPFGEMVNAYNSLNIGTIDENSPFQFVTATSNNVNSINQDVNGVDGGLSSTTTWEDLGGFTNPYSANGTAIPEPSVSLLSLFGILLLFNRRKI